MRTKHARADVPFKDLTTRNTKDAHSTKAALSNLLDSIESGGSFATSGVFSLAPLPDLSLHGFGPIPLPLAQRDADAICKERTEGDEGNVPQVERSVDRESGKHLHHQWEMKRDKMAIRNPAWNEYVQNVAAKAAEALGIKPDAGAVKAELASIRLWTAGACLAPYKDIPYVVGCFGKLLIRLPAAHEGGDLLATYGGETKTFSTETSCFWGYSYFAWYSDVTLELKPLGSGYRLMLVYDLIMPSPAKRPRLAHLYKEKEKLRDVLTAWNDSVKKDEATQKSNFPTLLAYICDSHYTSQGLNLNVLQGNDLLRAACLKDLCFQIGMDLYIANIDRTHSGFCDSHPSYYGEDDQHYIETTDEDFITWTKVVDLDGNTVAIDGSLDLDDNFIQSEPFEDIPDDEDFDRGHGLVTHSYRRTVLILIPSVAKVEWLPEDSIESRPNKRKRSVEVIDLE